MKGKIIKKEFFMYVNKDLHKIVNSWEELQDEEDDIMSAHKGYKLFYGNVMDFAVYVNKDTKEVFTYWCKIRKITNLKDSCGNIVCIGDQLLDNFANKKCWLRDYGGKLYVRYDDYLSTYPTPDIDDVSDLSRFTVTKKNPII